MEIDRSIETGTIQKKKRFIKKHRRMEIIQSLISNFICLWIKNKIIQSKIVKIINMNNP